MEVPDVKPVYAQAFFHWYVDGFVRQVMVFEYLDRDEYYFELSRHRDLVAKELEEVRENMQRLLDEEIVRINGVRVKPVVRFVELGFRGSRTRPFFLFVITFDAPIRKGENLYEDFYEETVAEYDYEFMWFLPLGSDIVGYEFGGGEAELIDRNVIRVRVSKGAKVGNYEWIRFNYHPPA